MSYNSFDNEQIVRYQYTSRPNAGQQPDRRKCPILDKPDDLFGNGECMKSEEQDRRVRRTRQLLHQALISLILEQPYHTITVQDILDRADIGRSTFYSHFQNKEALFQYGFDQMLDALTQQMESHHREETGGAIFPSLELFRHVQENQRLYKALLRGQGVELLLEHGQGVLNQRIERFLVSQHPAKESYTIPLPVLAHYLSGAFFTLLQWWLDNRMPYPPERMDEIYRQLVLPGVLRALETRG